MIELTIDIFRRAFFFRSQKRLCRVRKKRRIRVHTLDPAARAAMASHFPPLQPADSPRPHSADSARARARATLRFFPRTFWNCESES